VYGPVQAMYSIPAPSPTPTRTRALGVQTCRSSALSLGDSQLRRQCCATRQPGNSSALSARVCSFRSGVRDTCEMNAGSRILGLAMLALAAAPMVVPFTIEGSSSDTVCVAIRDTWHADRSQPPESDLREVEAALTAPLPSPEQMRDPQVRGAYLAAARRRQSTPGYKRAVAYMDWVAGPGACVSGAHRRAELSAVLMIAAVAIASTPLLRTRRKDPAPQAG
jgi:hypothetical protein